MNIPEHRKAIDKLDGHIVKLLNERTKHVLAIGEIKIKAGEEIYAPHRERAVLQRICRRNSGPMTNESLRAVYREIMSSALSLEKSMTIAYLGPEATFTHQAAIRRFGSSLRYSAQKTITDVFAEVSKNRADYGVVPIENSTEGVVTHTLDMFVDSDLKIVAQIVLPVQHCLLSNSRRSQIKKLFAHPQSLGQCRGWVQNNLPRAEIIETSSNARLISAVCRRKRGRNIFFPFSVKATVLTRRSRALSIRLTNPFLYRRSTATLTEPGLRSTFGPIEFTGIGPLCRSTSKTRKSDSPNPSSSSVGSR